MAEALTCLAPGCDEPHPCAVHAVDPNRVSFPLLCAAAVDLSISDADLGAMLRRFMDIAVTDESGDGR